MDIAIPKQKDMIVFVFFFKSREMGLLFFFFCKGNYDPHKLYITENMHGNVNARLTLVFIQYTEFVLCISIKSWPNLCEMHQSLMLGGCL